ncbi:MAG: hypothetical protein D3906_16890 [Candidatus Electrothrix sp. AUS1_2]|nr:hypothetical protein [Candidatus Electrothrix sp. AUS1_2]
MNKMDKNLFGFFLSHNQTFFGVNSMIAGFFRPRSLLIPLMLTLMLCVCLPLTVPAKAGQVQPVTLTLPVATLHQALTSLLPLPIEQHKQSRNFQGTFVVDSISRLTVKSNNVVALQGQLSGRNMAVNARVGNQSIQIKLGQVVLPVSCDIALRYDQQRRILILRPDFSHQTLQQDPTAASLGPLLDSLSKDYTLPLDNLDPLLGSLGATPIFVELEPVDIRLSGDSLVLQFIPRAGKIGPSRTDKQQAGRKTRK